MKPLYVFNIYVFNKTNKYTNNNFILILSENTRKSNCFYQCCDLQCHSVIFKVASTLKILANSYFFKEICFVSESLKIYQKILEFFSVSPSNCVKKCQNRHKFYYFCQLSTQIDFFSFLSILKTRLFLILLAMSSL